MERNGNDGGEAEYLPDESVLFDICLLLHGLPQDLLHLARVYIGFESGWCLARSVFLVGYGAAAVALKRA